MLKKLYVSDSLSETDDGFQFKLKNTLATSTIVGSPVIEIDGTPVDVTFSSGDETVDAVDISEDNAYAFEKGMEVTVAGGKTLDAGAHTIKIKTPTDEWDTLEFEVEDTL